ncbi:MAG: YqjF family protein [Bacteroidia bacterium]
MASNFLTAEWRKLILANYAVDPKILQPYLPANTELDLWNNVCYVSVVGFMFLNTKLKGIPIPFHRNFEEANLRFYVKHQYGHESRRGAVFIKEIVPKPIISLVANTIYKEHYETMPMSHVWDEKKESWFVKYAWKKEKWHSISIETEKKRLPILPSSEAEFITEHYWGYTKINATKTSEYGVEHPRWEMYETKNYSIDIDFQLLYGADFAFLKNEKPISVFMAEGSAIAVKSGRTI